MWIRFIFIFEIFLSLSLVGPANALQCYGCSGDLGTNNDCEVNLDNVNQSDCTPGFVCSVYVIKEGNRSTVHRICEAENECEVIRSQSTHLLPTSNRTVESCRTCKTDLCNSSVFHKGSTLSLMLGYVSVFVVTFVFNKFQ